MILNGAKVITFEDVLDRVIHKLIVLKVRVLEHQVELELPRDSIRFWLRLAFPRFIIFNIQLTLITFTNGDLDKADFFGWKHPLHVVVHCLRAEIICVDPKKIIWCIHMKSWRLAWDKFSSNFRSWWHWETSTILNPCIYVLGDS